MLRQTISVKNMLGLIISPPVATESAGGRTTDRKGVSARAHPHAERTEEIATGTMTAATAETEIEGAMKKTMVVALIEIEIEGATTALEKEIGEMMTEIGETATAAIPVIEMTGAGDLRTATAIETVVVIGTIGEAKTAGETMMTRAAVIEPTPRETSLSEGTNMRSEVRIQRKKGTTVNATCLSVKIEAEAPRPRNLRTRKRMSLSVRMKSHMKKRKSGLRKRTDVGAKAWAKK